MSHDLVLKNDEKNRSNSQECHVLIRTEGLENTYGEFTFEIYGWDKSDVLKNVCELQNFLNKELYSIRKKIEAEIEKGE